MNLAIAKLFGLALYGLAVLSNPTAPAPETTTTMTEVRGR